MSCNKLEQARGAADADFFCMLTVPGPKGMAWRLGFRKRFFTREWLGTGTGYPGQQSQRHACNTLSDLVFEFWVSQDLNSMILVCNSKASHLFYKLASRSALLPPRKDIPCINMNLTHEFSHFYSYCFLLYR